MKFSQTVSDLVIFRKELTIIPTLLTSLGEVEVVTFFVLEVPYYKFSVNIVTSLGLLRTKNEQTFEVELSLLY